MKIPKLSKLELQIMEVLWDKGPSCVRDILEAFPAKKRPAYTTIQTIVYRLEAKKRCIGSERSGMYMSSRRWSRPMPAQRRLVDEFLSLFGGRTQPLMTHLIESGRLTPEDLKEAQKVFQKLSQKERTS